MPYILGTAGHVDHGKTALVKRLTGIETSHLPEEKKRGMTIELGFASLEDPVHGTVGIVDVPGHERFIRNMVAGTWGLDAALLIVAADDGWMQMSSDHLRVLKAMKIDSILLVITKSDLAEKGMLELLIEDANAQCEKIIGRKLPAVAVSSLTGSGIEELKAEITKLLSSSKKQSPSTPFLYVDRVFVLKGIGTTVTGTLRGKGLHTGDSLQIYPSNEECRIKSIQNHHKDVEKIDPGTRTALNLKLGEKTNLERGMLLAEKDSNFVLSGKELLVRIDEVFTNKEGGFKNHAEIEIALGSAHAIGSIHLNQFDRSLGRLSLEEPVASAWNQRAVLIRHGGSEILASARVLASFPSYKRIQFKEAFEVYRDKELPSIHSYKFNIEGFVEDTKIKTQELTSDKNEVIEYDSWRFLKKRLEFWENKILKTAQESQAGFTLEEVDLPVPQRVKTTVLKKLCDEKKLEKEAHIYKLSGRTGDDISKNAKALLDAAFKAGFEGIEIDKIKLPQARKEARDLIKLGKLICLENFLHYHTDFYKKAVNSLFAKYKTGDKISIADAREVTGLSRKYILPILNLLEKEGKLKRQDNDRIVL